MLNIYAQAFMTATRTNTTLVRDAQPEPNPVKRRWLPKGHWFVQRESYVDLDDL